MPWASNILAPSAGARCIKRSLSKTLTRGGSWPTWSLATEASTPNFTTVSCAAQSSYRPFAILPLEFSG